MFGGIPRLAKYDRPLLANQHETGQLLAPA